MASSQLAALEFILDLWVFLGYIVRGEKKSLWSHTTFTTLFSVIFVQVFMIIDTEDVATHTTNKESKKKMNQKTFVMLKTHPSVVDLCGISLSKLFQLEAFWHSFTDPDSQAAKIHSTSEKKMSR